MSRRIKTSLLCSQKKSIRKQKSLCMHYIMTLLIFSRTFLNIDWRLFFLPFFIYFVFVSHLNHKIKKWTPKINTQQENEMMETLRECLNTFSTFIHHFVRGVCIFIFTKSNFMNNYFQLCKFLILRLSLSYFSDWMSKLEWRRTNVGNEIKLELYVSFAFTYGYTYTLFE